MKKLVLCLLLGMAFAQEKPKPTEVKLPEIPTTYQARFYPLIIKQQSLRIDQTNLQKQFDADEKAIAEVNGQGSVIEAELMKELKLDPKKYTVSYKVDKMVVIEREPEKK